MRRILPAPAIGVLTVAAMFVWLMIWGGAILLPLTFLKAVMPVPAIRRGVTALMVFIVSGAWISGNRAIYTLLHGRRTAYRIDPALMRDRSALVICNHQSWADILILFDALGGRVPLPRFFLKRELFWVPLVGLLCWALDMPFMQRHSREAIAANPALKDRDLQTTRRFCEKYRRQPITVVNFVEGTRSSPAKRAAKQSPYRHLLRPKSAGLSFTLNAMGEQFAGLIDVTLAYQPTRYSNLWSFLCGEQSGVDLDIRLRPLPAEVLRGDYAGDAAFRERFQQWVNRLWAEKDEALIEKYGGRAD